MKARKVNKDWYRISTKLNKWDCTTEAVDIRRNQWGEWSVCSGQPEEFYKPVVDYGRYRFNLLSSAKLYAIDLARSLIEETAHPRYSNDKYVL
jgi:hypothetical protein